MAVNEIAPPFWKPVSNTLAHASRAHTSMAQKPTRDSVLPFVQAQVRGSAQRYLDSKTVLDFTERVSYRRSTACGIHGLKFWDSSKARLPEITNVFFT